MKKTSLFIATLLLLVACGNKNSEKAYTISGTVPSNVTADWVYLYSVGSDTDEPIDSARVANGSFLFKGIVPDTIAFATLHPGAVNEYPAISWNLILEPGELVADTSSTFVTGTPLNDGMKDWMNQLMAIMMNGEVQVLPEFFREHWQEHSSDVVGAYILMNVWNMIDFQLVDSLFSQIPPEVQNVNLIRQYLVEPVNAVREMQPGMPFKDVDLLTLDGNPVKLSDYIGKGEYIIVDFWASWCGPCRQAIPGLQEFARKNKKIKVLGVAVRDKAEDTQKAIQQLSITWPVICDPQVITGSIYGFNSIPFMMFFDPDGNIVTRDIHVENLDDILSNIK